MSAEVGPVHLTQDATALCGRELGTYDSTMAAEDFRHGMQASIAVTVCHGCIEAVKRRDDRATAHLIPEQGA